jgi:hypothetical protein
VRARVPFLALLLAGAIAITAFASSDARQVVGNCTKSQVHPATIVLACADYNLELTHLDWSSFGDATAYAKGDYYVNNCEPYCAAGKFHSYPIKVKLTQAKPCPDGHDDYREAAFTFIATKPKGAVSKFQLSCPLPG